MKSKTISNYLYNTMYQILVIILPFVTAPYIARVLGADGIGSYAYTYSIASYFVLFILLGLNNYGNRCCAQIQDNKEELSKAFINIYVTQFLRGILCVLIYILYVIYIAKYKSLALCQGLYVLSGIFDISWFFFGIEKFKLTAIRSSVIKLLCVLSIFIFVKDANDVNIYIMIIALSFLLNHIVLWWFLRREIIFIKPTINECKKHIIPTFMLFVPVIAISLYKIMDKIMLGYMSNMVQTGYYENSEKVISIPMSLITSLGVVMLPRMSKLVAEKSEDESKKLIERSMFFTLIVGSAMAFGIAAIATPFSILFYGIDFVNCGIIISILSPTILFISWANVLRTQVLLPHGMDNQYTITVLGGAVINIIINWLLIPKYGAIGAAIGTLVAEFGVALWQTLFLKDRVDIGVYLRQGLPFVVIGAVMYICVTSIGLITFQQLWVKLIIQIIAGVIVYCVFVIIYMKSCNRKWLIHIVKDLIKKRNMDEA